MPDEDDIATYVDPVETRRFGHDLGAGDLNGDGLVDVAVGAPDYDAVRPVGFEYGREGFVSIFGGDVRGVVLADDADSSLLPMPGDTLPDVSGRPSLLLGASVTVGDLSGDGYDDLVVGAPDRHVGSSASGYPEGSLLVFFGPIDESLAILEADAIIVGDETFPYMGGESVASQDLNGDGDNDLLVGNGFIRVDNGSISTLGGGSYALVFFGRISAGTSLATAADVVYSDPLPGVSEYIWGLQAQVVGDTNGNGRPEVMIAGHGGWIGMFGVPPGAY